MSVTFKWGEMGHLRIKPFHPRYLKWPGSMNPKECSSEKLWQLQRNGAGCSTEISFLMFYDGFLATLTTSPIQQQALICLLGREGGRRRKFSVSLFR